MAAFFNFICAKEESADTLEKGNDKYYQINFDNNSAYNWKTRINTSDILQNFVTGFYHRLGYIRVILLWTGTATVST